MPKINWNAYETSLKRRGSITFWVSEDVQENWYTEATGKPGGQQRYSDLAIETALTLRLVFGQALRQTEGFLKSIFGMMNVNLDSPDHTTLSRRSNGLELPNNCSSDSKESLTVIIDSTGLKIYGTGEWNEAKHGPSKRKQWRKLHLTVNESNLEIVEASLTTNKVGDPTEAKKHIDDLENPIDEFIADGAYDDSKIAKKLEAKSDGATTTITVPPPSNARLSKNAETNPTQRDEHIKFTREKGREAWECKNRYSRRLLVENTMGRFKQIIGSKLRARVFENQISEALAACKILNKMVQLGTPRSLQI